MKNEYFLKINLPERGYGRELCRFCGNEIHGELTITVHGNGELHIFIYGVGNKKQKEYVLKPNAKFIDLELVKEK